jgi:hypothetical protein
VALGWIALRSIAKLHYRLAAVDDGVLTQEIENDG